MAKDEAETEAAPAEGADAPKKGIVGKITGLLFGSMIKMIITGAVLLLIVFETAECLASEGPRSFALPPTDLESWAKVS